VGTYHLTSEKLWESERRMWFIWPNTRNISWWRLGEDDVGRPWGSSARESLG